MAAKWLMFYHSASLLASKCGKKKIKTLNPK